MCLLRPAAVWAQTSGRCVFTVRLRALDVLWWAIFNAACCLPPNSISAQRTDPGPAYTHARTHTHTHTHTEPRAAACKLTSTLHWKPFLSFKTHNFQFKSVNTRMVSYVVRCDALRMLSWGIQSRAAALCNSTIIQTHQSVIPKSLRASSGTTQLWRYHNISTSVLLLFHYFPFVWKVCFLWLLQETPEFTKLTDTQVKHLVNMYKMMYKESVFEHFEYISIDTI